jgi:hypothetical protein
MNKRKNQRSAFMEEIILPNFPGFFNFFRMKLLILTPIAERDVHFYLATADRLKSHADLKILFFSFYQPGNDLIRSRGYEVWDPYAPVLETPPSNWSAAFIEKHFATPPLLSLIAHEKLTFGLESDQAVLDKFIHMFWVCDHLLTEIEQKYPDSQRFIVQELAGFIGPLALFYSGMKKGWLHYFSEPSFFKGRIHLLKNNLNLHIPESSTTADSSQQVAAYLKKAIEQKVVVAAVKDSHHYKDMGIGKIFNATNFKKLSKKLYYKYVKGQRQEFDHIGNHVFRYLTMLKNRYQNAKAYSDLSSIPTAAQVFYFPFHVQLDFSLTIRTPQWLDQLALIEKLIPCLPAGAVLLAKEHPASIGCLDQTRLETLLKNPQFRLLHPLINSHDVLDRTTGVVTINSKVGAEALSRGLPVITFGNAFYTNRGLTPHYSDWNQVRAWFQEAAKSKGPMSASWKQFLENVWRSSYPTELYDLTPSNVEDFAQAVSGQLA